MSKKKDRRDRLYHFFGHWLLSVCLVIGIWSLIILFFAPFLFRLNSARMWPMSTPFLPTTGAEVKDRGWHDLDVVLVTGDAYVDHPSYGAAVIGRVLQAAGFRVGIIAQPDFRTTRDFSRLGRPRLFFGVTAGNMDSMVANYTAHKRPRLNDDYSPGGRPGLRPDHAAVVYANRAREAFRDVPIVLGGIEASLAGSPTTTGEERGPALHPRQQVILVYGMGETQVLDAWRPAGRKPSKGTAAPAVQGFKASGSRLRRHRGQEAGDDVLGWRPRGLDIIKIPSGEEVREDIDKFNEAFRTIAENCDPLREDAGSVHRYVLQYPIAPPLRRKTSMPFTSFYVRGCILQRGGWRARFRDGASLSSSLTKGLSGECLLPLSPPWQDRLVPKQPRRYSRKLSSTWTRRKDFRGTITDVGGPTANLLRSGLRGGRGKGLRQPSPPTPTPCRNLARVREGILPCTEASRPAGRQARLTESGFRDLPKSKARLSRKICEDHLSGRRVSAAPEHLPGPRIS